MVMTNPHRLFWIPARPAVRRAVPRTVLWTAIAGMTWGGPAWADVNVGHTAAPAASSGAPALSVKQAKEGELEAVSTGINKQKITVGKIDPPAAFNLEDIQNFPEERLLPVLTTL